MLGLSQKKVIYTLQAIFLGKTPQIIYIANDVFAASDSSYGIQEMPIQYIF